MGLYLLLLLLSVTSINKSLPYTPTDLIRLDCGSSSASTSLDGRNWEGDAKSKFHASNSETTSFAFTASQQESSVTQVPYMTARIFLSQFTYIFPVSPGPKFVRLYFYPATYSNLDVSKSFFSLTANNYTLLSNFSAFLAVSSVNPPIASFVKEYIITMWQNQKLNLTFSPSPSSFAFINGIEIVSMPNNLYVSGDEIPLPFVGEHSSFYLHRTTALETFYRLNVGGRDISGVNDTGMYREWLQDSNYIFAGQLGTTVMPRHVKIQYTMKTPPYTAPVMVYSTMRQMHFDTNVNLNFNLTWSFSVDAGFNYLVRLHFCEFRQEVTSDNLVLFFIFINNQTADELADVILWSGGNSFAVYKDYVVLIPKDSHSKQELWLALHPNLKSEPKYADAILNGLEIFKLSNEDGNLASPNHELMSGPPSPENIPKLKGKTNEKGSSIVIIGCSVFGSILILSLLFCFFVIKQRRGKDSGKSLAKSFRLSFSQTSRSSVTQASIRSSNTCRRFSIFEIEMATTKFDDEFVIGSGGFGNVYKGFIDDDATPVAIKRLHSSSRQGTHEFRTEIDMLSKLHNPHLVSLIGYCDDPGEMILVYEYMHRGTLRDHLYKTRNAPLMWKRRLEICIGAARGLHYLHTGVKHPIIHRDVKSTNILIDENWVAKVSDFGLSRMGPTRESQTHVSTVVRGSFGYVDPEYYRRQHLTEKSDVYSFGVVLLEVLCSRPPVIPGLPREQVNLADWGRICYRRGELHQIIDPHLRGNIDPISLDKFGEIAESCLRDQGKQRPAMGDVVCGLEYVLQLQGIAEINRISVDRLSEEQENPLLLRGEAITSDDGDMFSVSGGGRDESRSSISSGERSVAQTDPDVTKSETVFSEIMNQKGR